MWWLAMKVVEFVVEIVMMGICLWVLARAVLRFCTPSSISYGELLEFIFSSIWLRPLNVREGGRMNECVFVYKQEFECLAV